ncbi:MAG: pyruvate dehydrogenase (acetyl-transferring) E1 component subunit alpha [Dehalococcoidia bacterium]
MKLAEKLDLSKEELINFLRQMLLIRRFEEKAAEMYMRGKIGGFLHLYIGEEAVAVGAISCLKPEDYIVTHYREHGHALVRGIEAKRIMAELFGKATGTSKGKGGSMHLFDASKGFMGGYAIVGGMMPVGVGLALASQFKEEGRVTMCFFGDGAVNQGEFHESLNLAALWKLPIVFLCENNGYGMGTHVDKTFSGSDISKLAERYDMPCCQKIDGMDVLVVRDEVMKWVERARNGGGPSFVEVMTYRFRGHSMADPLEYRNKQEEEKWKKRDPIPLFKKRLLAEAVVSEEEMALLQKEVDREVEEAVEFAEKSPFPSLESVYEDVYV